MMRKFLIASATALVAALGLASPSMAAGGGDVVLQKGEWSFSGPFGHFDKGAMQRGFQVYREVCAGCHGVEYLAFRNLADLGYNEAEIKAIALEYEVMDGPDEDGEMFMRPARPADLIPSPYRNDNEARANNNGALPPDLSLIAKARANGPDYLYSLLIGYEDAPADVEVPDGMYYNNAYAGHLIAMPQPIYGDDVEYSDGSPTTPEGLAADLTHFLMWAAEPKMEIRKRIGVAAVFFLSIFVIFSYIAKRRVWAELH
ncbi:MAG: cytochrome c1 [Pseudomonadota bacterium]|jgi:ubiquinol-cytochrome c reductase cytochrome c1 subunit|nr:cytochrome c1 [Pseudomonadota bacterium]|tara:strand:- start:55 stop:828 length:774 start_codon:yes stop_codon:yes gene_type:complete